MKLFIELPAKQFNGRTRTHEVEAFDVQAFKKYARGQIQPIEFSNRPSWAIVKNTEAPASEGNSLFFVGVETDGYKMLVKERVYAKEFLEFIKPTRMPNVAGA